MASIGAYTDDNGRVPFQKWFNGLDETAAAKVNAYLTRLADGNTSQAKAVGKGVHELRIDWGPGYRVYFGMDGDVLVILLGGGTKKGQQNDIATAQERWKLYKAGKKGN
ncbi:MAG: type II toxin-antitoxin system RelE/ParE family toxin [Flavobacteriales bacterium]|nr:type II toxin-antitoxin system RelE/ParE family toxin [Flavobacteriales bacterium]